MCLCIKLEYCEGWVCGGLTISRVWKVLWRKRKMWKIFCDGENIIFIIYLSTNNTYHVYKIFKYKLFEKDLVLISFNQYYLKKLMYWIELDIMWSINSSQRVGFVRQSHAKSPIIIYMINIHNGHKIYLYFLCIF